MPNSDSIQYLVGPFIAIALAGVGLVINIIVGAIAVSMAKKRCLRTVPAFFAGFFGSFLALFFIAMFPKSDNASWN